MVSRSNDKIYWANKPPEELGREIRARIDACVSARASTDLMWDKLERAYYGEDFTDAGYDSTGVAPVGDPVPNKIGRRTNHLRAILQIQHNMVTQTVLVHKAKAKNGSQQAARQAALASDILPQYEEARDIPRLRGEMDRIAGLYGCGYLHLKWEVDDVGGEDSDDLMALVSSGDVVATPLEPYKVYFDPTWDGRGEMPWVVVAEKANKYELWAQYGSQLDPEDPLHKDLERAIFGSGDEDRRYWYEADTIDADGDYVVKYTFYHPRSRRCPDGKVCQMVGDMILTPDVGWPFDFVPVVRECIDMRPGNPFGYTTSWSLLGLQETNDIITSAMLSAIEQASASFWHVPPEAQVSAKDLTSGFIMRTNSPPQLIQFQANVSNYLEALDRNRKDIDDVSGANAVTRGDAEHGIFDNARAMNVAALQAFNRLSERHDVYKAAAQRISRIVLEFLREHVGLERTMTMTGMDQEEVEEAWTGSDLADIEVSFDVVNPAMNHLSGRLDVLEYMYEKGVPFHASEYDHVLTTGRLDVVLNPLRLEQRTIAKENEMLAQGIRVPVLPGDNHLTHWNGHMKNLSMDLRMLIQRLNEQSEADAASAAEMGMPPPPMPELTPAEEHLMAHVTALRDTPNEVLAMTDVKLLELKRMALEVEALVPPPPPPMGAEPPPPPPEPGMEME